MWHQQVYSPQGLPLHCAESASGRREQSQPQAMDLFPGTPSLTQLGRSPSAQGVGAVQLHQAPPRIPVEFCRILALPSAQAKAKTNLRIWGGGEIVWGFLKLALPFLSRFILMHHRTNELKICIRK